MEFLAPFHPQITHVPIVLIPLAFLFELAGRALDRDWWRKAALAILVAGVIGAWLSVQSGHGAEETADKQGVPQEAIDEHEEMATLMLWLSLAALAARAGCPSVVRGGGRSRAGAPLGRFDHGGGRRAPGRLAGLRARRAREAPRPADPGGPAAGVGKRGGGAPALKYQAR